MDTTPAATGAEIYNLTLTLAATEYPQLIHDGVNTTPSVKKIMFRLRDKTQTLQYSYKAGGPYFDLLAGEIYWEDGLDTYMTSIYFKTPNAGALVNIEIWR